MPIETIKFKDKEYPAFQAKGNAARWVIPFALEYCKGQGIDIGCNRLDWALPTAIKVVDPELTPAFNAMEIPDSNWDFIFSSHCLEHVKENWNNVLDYWLTKIKVGGIIFLYLPHKSQEYWLPENNRKHIHSFDGSEISEYLRGLGHKVIRSGVDLNNSFVVVCEKKLKVPDIGTPEYYEIKKREIADEKELYCKERNISYIREGNNVIYNEPTFHIRPCGDPAITKSQSVNVEYFFDEQNRVDRIWFNGKYYTP